MKRSVITTFLVIEAVLYVIFLGMDLFSFGDSIGLKYISILLCLLFSFLCMWAGGDAIVPFALVCTALADFFLLVIDAYYLIGIFSFLVAQTLYLIRLYRGSGKLWLLARAILAAGVVLIVFVAGMASPLNVLSMVYYSLLLINMAISWTLPGRSWRLFAIGLSLFVLCDTCVGLFNLGAMVPAALYQFTTFGMWLFYLPSQVLIALTCLKGREGKE